MFPRAVHLIFSSRAYFRRTGMLPENKMEAVKIIAYQDTKYSTDRA